MTKFVKDQFQYSAGYLTYGPDQTFIARFKYAAISSKPRFVTFLCENMTVEEYFAERAAGVSPLEIVERRGFVLTHILNWLRNGTLTVWKDKPASYYI